MNPEREHPMDKPLYELRQYQSIKVVRAGEIYVVDTNGCWVGCADDKTRFFPFVPGMLARYTPVTGDFWVQYDDGYESISPRKAFVEGYVSYEADAQSTWVSQSEATMTLRMTAISDALRLPGVTNQNILSVAQAIFDWLKNGSVSTPITQEAIEAARREADTVHASDCAAHNAPAYPPGPCDCGAAPVPPTGGHPLVGPYAAEDPPVTPSR